MIYLDNECKLRSIIIIVVMIMVKLEAYQMNIENSEINFKSIEIYKKP